MTVLPRVLCGMVLMVAAAQPVRAQDVPLWGRFEAEAIKRASYANPFRDIELTVRFTSPTGRHVDFPGYYDGDGHSGQDGHVWKMRFMPDELGIWTYVGKFSDGVDGPRGNFWLLMIPHLDTMHFRLSNVARGHEMTRTELRSFESVVCRRDFLQLGGLGTCGLALPALLQARDAPTTNSSDQRHRGAAKSCIIIFQQGGPSHLDTFDMKPDAPAEIRGEFSPIATSTPGYQICEHLPMLAQQMHRCSIVRGVCHSDTQHNNAGYTVLTGGKPNLLPNTVEALAKPGPDDHPPVGAVLTSLRTSPDPWVSLPYPCVNGVHYPGQTAGFLGSRCETLWLRPDPQEKGFVFPEFEFRAGTSTRRMHDRASLLRALNEKPADDISVFQAKALDLLTSSNVRRALRLKDETPRLRELYGHNVFGQSCLLSRRLIEAGVNLVNIYSVGLDGFPGPLPLSWDTHFDNFKMLKKDILPHQDRGFAALLQDLAERGLLDETLVVWFGEFGRSPAINQQAGREHWPFVYSVVFAGGGTKAGKLFGASDRFGAYPVADPVTPQDIAATIYHCLGINPDLRLSDRHGRPIDIASGGKPIYSILA